MFLFQANPKVALGFGFPFFLSHDSQLLNCPPEASRLGVSPACATLAHSGRVKDDRTPVRDPACAVMGNCSSCLGYPRKDVYEEVSMLPSRLVSLCWVAILLSC